ncbi:MAG: GIY-YIG nuclease family protein [Methylococcales bacterium]
MSSKFKKVKDGEGWVYVATHEPYYKGLVKIGFSTNVPQRMKELQNGSPFPYIAEYRVLVSNAYLLEQEIHKFLDKKRSVEGEWFSCTVKEAQDAIKEVAKQQGIEIELTKQVEVESKKQLSKTKNIKLSNSKVKTPPPFIKELFPNLKCDDPVDGSTDFLNTVLLAKSSNVPSAQFKLGLMYQLGKGTNRDYKEAIEWYKKAANQGHIDAQINLARMFYDFSWITKNYTEASQWFTKASEQGNVDAYYYLGKMYQHGHGVKQDLKNSGNFYDKALENGDDEMKRKVIDVYYNLGNMCQHGNGVEIDLDKAENFYIKAIESGDGEMKRKVIRACLNKQKIGNI